MILTITLYLISLWQISETSHLCKILTGLGRKETMIRKFDGARSKKRTILSRSDSKIRESKAQAMWNWALLKQGDCHGAAQKQAEVVSL